MMEHVILWRTVNYRRVFEDFCSYLPLLEEHDIKGDEKIGGTFFLKLLNMEPS